MQILLRIFALKLLEGPAPCAKAMGYHWSADFRGVQVWLCPRASSLQLVLDLECPRAPGLPQQRKQWSPILSLIPEALGLGMPPPIRKG